MDISGEQHLDVIEKPLQRHGGRLEHNETYCGSCYGAEVDSFLARFLLGWAITFGTGLGSYPIDTVRRRMMMTSGEAIKYKSSIDAFNQIIKNEGPKSLFKSAGANILRTVAGAGVFAGYDKLQLIVLAKKYGSGGG